MELFSNEQSGLEMMKHLREQINNVMGAIQVLTPAIRENENRKYNKYLAAANHSLHQIIRMIGNVETAQTEELTFQPALLDLVELCRTLGEQVTPLLSEVGVSFCHKEDQNSVLTIADSALLQRMLLNLISNAAQSAGKNKKVELQLSGDMERVRLTVWDDGSWEEPQASDSMDLTPKRGGLGLGLTVARQIAALHGGTIVFEHGEERGVRAVVSLPVHTDASKLSSPHIGYDRLGGFSQPLVELSDLLPFDAYMPADIE